MNSTTLKFGGHCAPSPSMHRALRADRSTNGDSSRLGYFLRAVFTACVERQIAKIKVDLLLPETQLTTYSNTHPLNKLYIKLVFIYTSSEQIHWTIQSSQETLLWCFLPCDLLLYKSIQPAICTFRKIRCYTNPTTCAVFVRFSFVLIYT